MHSTLILAAITLAFSHITQAAPLQSRQDASLVLADTVVFIAKTIGTNPNSDTLPDVNNWLATPVHSAAGQNLFVLSDPSTTSLNLSAPGFFRNGTNPGAVGADTRLTAGLVAPDYPYSIVFELSHNASDPNPGAEEGFVELDVGTGTAGVDVVGGQLGVTYAFDIFYACPNIVVEGSEAIAVGVVSKHFFLSFFLSFFFSFSTAPPMKTLACVLLALPFPSAAQLPPPFPFL